MARDCALVVHSDEVDERRYDIFETRNEGNGVVVMRHCWWFDEETERWVLDDSSEWYLTPDQAMQLGMAMQQAGTPSLVRSSVG
ncbi:MAG: hypothetical protein AAF211_21045 [Myxococcota bacterium]